jgi:hypothetical protein
VQLADLGLRRQAGRQKQQGGDRQPGDAEGARVRQGALRHLHPGTLSWLDPNNNKAFLDGQISSRTTASRSTTRQELTDPKVKELQSDIQHAPSRRAGRRAHRVAPVLQPDGDEVHQVPAGAKEFPALMIEQEQFEPG